MGLEEFRLDGEIVILTGEREENLRELVSVFIEVGAIVIIVGNESRLLDKILQLALECGGNATAIKINTNYRLDIEEMVRKVVSRFGRIDILVNDSSKRFGKPFEEITDKEWYEIVTNRLTSIFLFSQIVGIQMKKQKSGKIINIISGLAERGLPNCTAYCASMGGISQMNRALALEWARYNVRINAVGVGWMENDFTGGKEKLIRYIPMKRLCKPEDISPLVLFLASSASSYMTGYTFYVDGGLMARG